MANLIFIFILVLLLQCRPTNGCRSGGRRYYKEGSCTSCGAGCKDGRCNDDGSCSCKAQWAGRGCKTKCTDGYVQGHSCVACGSGCQLGRCDADDGTCRCKSGWIGRRCTIRCRYGYYVYARVCRRCSTWCQSRGCNPDDGTCKCRLGWAGRRCTIQMPVSGTPRTSTTLENVTNTEPEQGGELLKSAENQTWPYILIYSLTPVVIISCTILGLSLAIKRRRSRKTSTNSGAKVPSTTDGLGAGQAVQLADVSEAGEDRHYDVIHEPVTQVDASDADKPDHVTDENVYAVPFENRDVNFYENTCQSTDGNMYAIPTANMDTHVYEGIKTRTKISRK